MTAATQRILAVLVLGMAGVTLPISGQEPSRTSERADTGSKRFTFGFLAGMNHTSNEQQSTLFQLEQDTVYWWNQPEGWLVGGFVELNLGARFSVQAGLSYVRAYMWQSRISKQTGSTFQDRQDSYEAPVTLNYRLGSANWRPVIGAGPAFRNQLYGGSYGAVALFGVEGRMGPRWTIAPQLRYFRWAPGDIHFRGPRNRVQALVVVTF